MKGVASKPVLTVVGCALGIIGCYLFSFEKPGFSIRSTGIVEDQSSIQQGVASLEDIEQLRWELKTLAGNLFAWNRRVEALRRELSSLRSRVAGVDGLGGVIPSYPPNSDELNRLDEDLKAGRANAKAMLIEETINV